MSSPPPTPPAPSSGVGVPDPPLRFYVFYFDDALEGEHAHRVVLDNDLPHLIQKFAVSAYGGAVGLNRGWGRIYVPEPELERFMALTRNRFAPEPELYVPGGARGDGSERGGCLAWWRSGA